MRKDIAKKVLNHALPFFNNWKELLNQACITHTPINKTIDELGLVDFYRLADDGWFDVYEEDAYADLRSFYGKDFKSDAYLKKTGGFKQKKTNDGIKSYAWIQYCYHIATALHMRYQGKI